ncbi:MULTISPECIES: ubiquinol-cytochrome C chaperone family protein [unclassified Sphingomonas]|uniref:ubiquinol-cytochrome C chaperone family protein n=1 Tax=unclassified Sphingomonas TaxID=196159 RepID=UPI0006F398C3|nr:MULTISPECIES: ubiquinol-cytochrome C chaperone family protein [unclassified Sphingomonas]KQX17922.1 ubiquinol-cytochrome C chaperone [Sphingomonas sp. Root1294]KQY70847.1 ubiquinol-cytochrome C chaperone [Sphingomonas sp. Root50]KRB91659.1 ubiquinol-cytochrome C chaperone [Sphingomonas sp. Root720]
MKFLKTLFGFGPDPREELVPLYGAIVAEARDPMWYAEAGVPDTLDGRFDMVAAILSLVLVRIDAEGNAGRASSALLTEVFIDDMEGQVRQLGIGDVIVGKHLGKMVAAMGGRLSAYRDAIDDRTALAEALVRNLWRGEPGREAKPVLAAERLQRIAAELKVMPWAGLLAGKLR